MGASKSKDDREQHRAVIFIVDDEPMLLELSERILGSQNYEIRTFSDPEKALKAYATAEKAPDLVITDFAMHRMDGMALIRECRRVHPRQKILLVSGTVDESVFSGAATKPDRFLAKPYLPAQLLAAVQETLAH